MDAADLSSSVLVSFVLYFVLRGALKSCFFCSFSQIFCTSPRARFGSSDPPITRSSDLPIPDLLCFLRVSKV
jgi:hypothetical protein